VIYLLTGQPGAGKSTIAVQHAIFRYASNGRRVVANFPIDFAPVCRRADSKLSAASVWVLPDRPTRADLDAIGEGGPDEERVGLLIVDEAGTWLNARTWQGQDRESIIDWLTQSRKRRWDVILVAQAVVMLDKQVREAVCECVAKIRRLDRLKVLGMAMPRIHIAIVRYGVDANAPVVERWIYRGKEAQKCFGSYRLFGADSSHYQVLPATLSRWRYQTLVDWAALGRELVHCALVLFALSVVKLSGVSLTDVFRAEPRRLPSLRRQSRAAGRPGGRGEPAKRGTATNRPRHAVSAS
jgi:hypothetical protein